MFQKGNITVDNRNDLLTSTVIMGSSYLEFCGPGTSWLQNCQRIRLSLCPGSSMQRGKCWCLSSRPGPVTIVCHYMLLMVDVKT